MIRHLSRHYVGTSSTLRSYSIDMQRRLATKHSVIVVLLMLTGIAAAQKFEPAVPRTFDDQAMAVVEMPLTVPDASPKQISSKYYYGIPVRPVYKSYPVYHPSKEPAGYFEWLKKQEPDVAFDAAKLKTREDWIRAGELVFDAPSVYG